MGRFVPRDRSAYLVMARCPSCGTEAEPYDPRTSDWCEPCTRKVLGEQEQLRWAPQEPEHISYLENA